jgi:putative ABC transport system permease protein
MIMFLTANALGHSIRERTAELAVLKTLGFSNVSVVTLVLTEAALPCLFGCFLGLAVAKGAAAAMPFISPAGFALPPLEIDFEVVSSGIGAALLIALVAAAMPVLRIMRLDVAAALARH